MKFYELMNDIAKYSSYNDYNFMIDFFYNSATDGTCDDILYKFETLLDDSLQRIYSGTNDFPKKYSKLLININDQKLTTFLEECIEPTSKAKLATTLKKNYKCKCDTSYKLIAFSISELCHQLGNSFSKPKSKAKVTNKQYDLKTTEIRKNKVYINSKFVTELSDELTHFDYDESMLPYVNQLLLVFAEELGMSEISYDDVKILDEKCMKIFTDEKINYTQARFVEKTVSEHFDDGLADVEILKDEMFEGLKFTVDEDYDSGLKKMRNVLQESMRLSLSSTEIASKTDLLTNEARKGFCHVLVDDDKIKWID